MSKRRRNETQEIFDAASADTTVISVALPVAVWTTATLMVLDYISELERDDKRTFALLELLAAFGSPVVERHARTEELIHEVVYRATGIRVFFGGGPG